MEQARITETGPGGDGKTLPSPHLAPVASSPEDGAQIVQTALEKAEGDIYVDFDETLFLDSSTLAFLRTAQPQILVWVIFKLVSILSIWKLLPGEDKKHIYVDWLRTLLTAILLPWSLPLWAFVHAPRLAREKTNQALLDVLKEYPGRAQYVVSFGFKPILKPLMKRIAPNMPVMAAGLLNGYTMRRIGKRDYLTRKLGADRLANGTIITDSKDDADLMETCRSKAFLKWPGSKAEIPFKTLYVPFLYTERAKRPHYNYIMNAIVKYDIIAIALAFAWFMPNPFLGAVGLAILYLGMWIIYELGYVENDRMAAERETNGVLQKGWEKYSRRMSYTGAAACAFLSAIIGITLVNWAQGDFVLSDGIMGAIRAGWINLIIWCIFLILGYGLYRLYNTSTPPSRIIMYPGLQLFRLAGFSIVASTSMVGAFLLAAIALGRWYPYLVHRATKIRWSEYPRLLALVTFLTLSFIGLSVNPMEFLTFQTLVIILWLIYRSRSDMINYMKEFHFLKPAGD